VNEHETASLGLVAERERRRAHRMSMQSLYAIVDSAGGSVKFGISWNPAIRLTVLASSNPGLTLDAEVGPRAIDEYLGLESARDLEVAIHARLGAHRIRGEWFRLNDETGRAISMLAALDLCEGWEDELWRACWVDCEHTGPCDCFARCRCTCTGAMERGCQMRYYEGAAQEQANALREWLATPKWQPNGTRREGGR